MGSFVTTETVARTERFDHWAHEVSKVFGDLDSRPAAPTSFHGKATSDTLGLLQFASIDAAPLAVRRTKRLAVQHEEDYYKVALQVAGNCLIEQDGATESLGPGDLAICDTSRPYSFTYESDFRTVLMLLPRPMLPMRPETIRDITARRLTTDGGVGAVVGPFLRSLSEQNRACSDAAVLSLTDGVVSLVTALVSEKLAGTAQAAPQKAMMLRIRTYIENRLSNPNLTPDTIAEAHGISRRYLFKLFAAEDLTVAGWIRTRRLEHCARDLANPASGEQPISLIAARWGLLDCRHFSRVFKSVYGATPRDFRNRALAQAEVEAKACF
ncbi:helix-turn-helix domain-containing protein [Streptomyces sp. NPDC002088]|uniref:AraC-like ligand-binding domain-containing protein n=1 Tax=Streptomyces sp. NPDC002088 TaxID=3154665 RepID=UPI0033333D79